MKRILKIGITLIIFIISFICVDGLCSRFFNTRPIIAMKNVLVSDNVKVKNGYVYKSLFANVYYCNTIYTSYDNDGNKIIEDKIMRYYFNNKTDFVCPIWVDERSEINQTYRDEAIKHTDTEYMKLAVMGLYKAGYYKTNSLLGSYNSKLGVYIYNFIGDSLYVSEELQDVYMFDVNDFSKEPIKMKIDGYDLTWRGTNIVNSPSGNIMAFYYVCGYRDDQWMGWQKYNQDDCLVNDKDNGVYVFRVNGINDYTLLKVYPEDRNMYLKEYKESYFNIYKIIDDENIVFKYIVTNNKQEAPLLEVYYKWNIISDTLTEWQG